MRVDDTSGEVGYYIISMSRYTICECTACREVFQDLNVEFFNALMHLIICSSSCLSTGLLIHIACPAIDEIMHHFVSFCCITMLTS